MCKEGGFTEKMVMEELPVYRVNAYYHAALRSHDVWTVREQPKPEIEIDHLLAYAASVDMEEEE